MMEETQINSEEISAEKNELITEDELKQKHKLEKKELQATIQKLKRNANNCKKKKKEATEEILKLETEMKEKHERELTALLSTKCTKETTEQIEAGVAQLTVEETDDSSNDKATKVSRAAKRRAKKAEAATQREAELQRERDYQFLHSPRAIENRAMKALLKQKGLKVTDILPDGDCMYAAVSHQLGGDRSHSQLRQVCADYLRQHKDDFQPFLTHPDTGDLLDDEGYSEYCDNVADTHTWGGQPELRALSESLQRRIDVLQVEGSSIVLGEAFQGAPLLLAYYRHCYALGEHYNSLTPVAEPS